MKHKGIRIDQKQRVAEVEKRKHEKEYWESNEQAAFRFFEVRFLVRQRITAPKKAPAHKGWNNANESENYSEKVFGRQLPDIQSRCYLKIPNRAASAKHYHNRRTKSQKLFRYF